MLHSSVTSFQCLRHLRCTSILCHCTVIITPVMQFLTRGSASVSDALWIGHAAKLHEKCQKVKEKKTSFHGDQPATLAVKSLQHFLGVRLSKPPFSTVGLAYRERHSFWPEQTAKKKQKKHNRNQIVRQLLRSYTFTHTHTRNPPSLPPTL